VVFSHFTLILVLTLFVSRAGYEMALINGFQSRPFTFGFLALRRSRFEDEDEDEKCKTRRAWLECKEEILEAHR
jgi:hypothetical protein